MSSDPAFGIDLGTMNTVVAYSFEIGIPTPVSIKNSLVTPSVLSFNANSYAVGNELETNPNVADPQQLIRMVKRIMALPKDVYDGNRQNFSMLEYEIAEDDEKMCSVKVQFRGEQKIYLSEFLSGLLLAAIKSELVAKYNLTDRSPRVVISVPAYFNTIQRRAIEAAGKMAKFKVLRVVNEPIAGAFV